MLAVILAIILVLLLVKKNTNEFVVIVLGIMILTKQQQDLECKPWQSQQLVLFAWTNLTAVHAGVLLAWQPAWLVSNKQR